MSTDFDPALIIGNGTITRERALEIIRNLQAKRITTRVELIDILTRILPPIIDDIVLNEVIEKFEGESSDLAFFDIWTVIERRLNISHQRYGFGTVNLRDGFESNDDRRLGWILVRKLLSRAKRVQAL